MAPTSEGNNYKPTFAFAKSSHLVGGLGLGICTQMMQLGCNTCYAVGCNWTVRLHRLTGFSRGIQVEGVGNWRREI